MKDWKKIIKNSERYRDFTILDEPMSFKEFATNHGDIDLVQIHSAEVIKIGDYYDLAGFAGHFSWKNNTLTPLDGDSYNENMTVLAYDWFYPITIDGSPSKYSGECLDILVGDDW